MQVLWTLEEAFVNDMLDQFTQPKPAYNTVSTIMRILEDKGFIGHKNFGRSHQYYPLISREEYQRFKLKNIATDYFGGSFQSLVSFMAEEKDISLRDIEEIRKTLKRKSDD